MKTKFNRIKFIILMMGIVAYSLVGCKKFVEADLPIDKVTAKAVFNTTSGAVAVLSDIYFQTPVLSSNISIWGGLLADELILHDASNQSFQRLYTNTLAPDNNLTWDQSYGLIFRINSLVEGVESSASIPILAKNELIGQAKFLRAYTYFYLVNLYGGVPLVTSTDYKINMLLPRSVDAAIYDQIIQDLTEAQNLVSENYLAPDLHTVTSERVTANKAVTTALLARVYLYTKQWSKAESEASKLISNPKYAILESLNTVFLKNSTETIWQIEGDISKGENAIDGNAFIPDPPGYDPGIYLSDNLLNAFIPDDKRQRDWFGTRIVGTNTFYYPFKYKKRNNVQAPVTTEYNMMLRLAEQFLIRSEARAHLNNLGGAIEDLNVIRKRAGVPLYTTLDQQAFFTALEKEWQIEFFTESGHRWLDLKRTNRADAILAPIKGSNWQSTDKLLPIPSREFASNPNMRGNQNPGYPEQ